MQISDTDKLKAIQHLENSIAELNKAYWILQTSKTWEANFEETLCLLKAEQKLEEVKNKILNHVTN